MPFDYPNNETESGDYRIQDIPKYVNAVNRASSNTAKMMMQSKYSFMTKQ